MTGSAKQSISRLGKVWIASLRWQWRGKSGINLPDETGQELGLFEN
jgi:hypothetical protein